MIRQNRFLEQRKNTVECTVMDTCRYMFVQTQSPAEKWALVCAGLCVTVMCQDRSVSCDRCPAPVGC